VTVEAAPAARGARVARSSRALSAGLLLAAAALVATCALSLAIGSRTVPLETVWQALVGYDPGSVAQEVVRELRVPRTCLGVLVGAALGLSGTLLQGVTRNPLADPGIMGISAGAAAFVVFGIMVLGAQELYAYVWLGFLGAALATVLVYGVASLGREGATPVKLALVGAAVTAGLTSITNAIVLIDNDALDALRQWEVGTLGGRFSPVVWQVLPFIAGGALVALACGRALNGLALGEDVARALGMRVGAGRFVLFAGVAVLAGAATAACGPIAFLGLAVPHLARMICGPDYRWILRYSLVLGPIVLLLADVLGRVALPSGELQVGVVLGVLGGPIFVALVRYKNLVEL
jgi:iron complex transport system permease protein